MKGNNIQNSCDGINLTCWHFLCLHQEALCSSLASTWSAVAALCCVQENVQVLHFYMKVVLYIMLAYTPVFFLIFHFIFYFFLKAKEDERTEDEGRALYKNFDVKDRTIRTKWCQTCRFYRPPRSSHCSMCNGCIEVCVHCCFHYFV